MIAYRHPTAAEHEAALDLVAVAFPHPRAAQPEVRRAVLADPDYHPLRTIVAVEGGGEVVGHCAVKRCEVRVGDWFLPAARLGTVCVAPTARRLGVGRELVERSAALVEDAAVVILNPADEEYVRLFYQRLGFVSALRSEGAVKVPVAALPPANGHLVRPAAAADVPTLHQLYQETYLPQPGSLSRSFAWWQRRVAGEPLLWCAHEPEVLVAETAGQVAGYAVTFRLDDGNEVWELAAAAADPAAGDVLLQAAAFAGQTEIRVLAPPTDPLAPRLLAAAGTRSDCPPRPVMLRAGNLATLQAVLAEVAAPVDWLDDGHVAVQLEAGTAVTSPTGLLALAYDGRVATEGQADGWLRLSPDGPATLAALADRFPARVASRRVTDAF